MGLLRMGSVKHTKTAKGADKLEITIGSEEYFALKDKQRKDITDPQWAVFKNIKYEPHYVSAFDLYMKKTVAGGAICGGVISENYFQKCLKQDKVEGIMMAFVLPDKQFKEYALLKEQGEDDKASWIFKKFARSVI